MVNERFEGGQIAVNVLFGPEHGHKMALRFEPFVKRALRGRKPSFGGLQFDKLCGPSRQYHDPVGSAAHAWRRKFEAVDNWESPFGFGDEVGLNSAFAGRRLHGGSRIDGPAG